MADVIIDPENKNAKELLSQGIRAYALQDYTASVQALGKASEILVSEHGDDLHDSLGDVYFYYGKALLALSRQESEPLGDAIPKGETEESEEEEDEEAENDVNEEKDKTEKNGVSNGETAPTEKKEQNGAVEKEATEEKADADADEKTEQTEASGSGDVDNEEPTDLQVAWEVLELAKKIFEKRGTDGKKQLAETLTSLGEISLESENFEAAITDIKDGLAIQEEIFPKDSRKVAETCYNLGIAFSTNSQIDEAIDAFNKSLEYLNNRISVLEKQDNGEEEIKEIKELIPELLEKINDMKSYKEETIKKLAELTKQPESASKILDGASSSSSKQPTDISHLVKRKRKPEETDGECNPPKKLSQ